MTGKRAEPLGNDIYEKLLRPFLPVLEEEHLRLEKKGEQYFLNSCDRLKRLEIYPAMWSRPSGENLISISDAEMKHARPRALNEMLAF